MNCEGLGIFNEKNDREKQQKEEAFPKLISVCNVRLIKRHSRLKTYFCRNREQLFINGESYTMYNWGMLNFQLILWCGEEFNTDFDTTGCARELKAQPPEWLPKYHTVHKICTDQMYLWGIFQSGAFLKKTTTLSILLEVQMLIEFKTPYMTYDDTRLPTSWDRFLILIKAYRKLNFMVSFVTPGNTGESL